MNKLLTLKSLVTLGLTLTLIACMFLNPCAEIMTLFTTVTASVFAFYFKKEGGG